MKFNAFGGSMNTSLKFDARKWEAPVIDVKNIIEGFDLNQILRKNHKYMEGTGISYENISGILTSNISTRAFFYDGSWEPPTNRIRVKGDRNNFV